MRWAKSSVPSTTLGPGRAKYELARLALVVDRRDHRCMQRVHTRKGPRFPRRRSDPRRVFENATQQRDEGIAIERIDGGQSHSKVINVISGYTNQTYHGKKWDY